MPRFVLLALLLLGFAGCASPGGTPRGKAHPEVAPGIKALATIDPHCGMKVPANTPYTLTVSGQTFRFCSAACRDAFAKDPQVEGGNFFDAHCPCQKTMPDCLCDHCEGAFKPCDCVPMGHGKGGSGKKSK